MTDFALQAARAERLRGLHRGSSPLLLPNAWDAASARAVVEAGFAAVATTSAGVARSLGFDDGEKAPAAEMFAAVARIVRSVGDVPVSADIEAGYGLDAAALADRLLATGAAGCNLEDSDHDRPGTLVDADRQADRIAAVKHRARDAGVDVVLNARVDVFVRQVGREDERVGEAVRRGRLYVAAGADCVFPIIVQDEAAIASLVEGIPAPLNVLALEGGPSLARLRQLGVARISFGGRFQRAAHADHQRRLAALRAGEDFLATRPPARVRPGS